MTRCPALVWICFELLEIGTMMLDGSWYRDNQRYLPPGDHQPASIGPTYDD